MKKIFLIICALQSGMLCAQQLYFLRATVDENYEFYKLPPVQIIAYMPEQDTVLQVYKDYTIPLHLAYRQPSKIDYYPKLGTFCITILYFKCFLFNVNRTDTLIEIAPPCPSNYKVSTLRVINNYWAYRCTDIKASDEDYAVFRGMDSSFNNQFDLEASAFKDLHLTGASDAQDVVLKPNDKNIYLPIVADSAKRPIFSVELPPQYWVDKKTSRILFVNDDLQTLLSLWDSIPSKEKDYGRFCGALYNKQKNTWRDLELKGNSPSLMAYGHWLAGVVQDQTDWDSKYFIGNKVSPGRSERDSVAAEYNFDSWATSLYYRPGILYLFNTDTEKYIEWHTGGQGDSEILLVQDETVYYRVFDKIYKAAIVAGERLGQPELLVKDSQVVPYIHWAFTSPVSAPVRKAIPFDRRHELLYTHVYQSNNIDRRDYQVQIGKIFDRSATLPLGYTAAEENEWVNSWEIGAYSSLDIARGIVEKIQQAAAGEKVGSLALRKKVACVGAINIDRIAYPVAVYSERDTVANLRKVQVSSVDELRTLPNRLHLRYDDSFAQYIVLAFYEEGSAEPSLMLQVEKAAERYKRSTLEEWLKFLNIVQAPEAGGR